jgi:hypothetical protein
MRLSPYHVPAPCAQIPPRGRRDPLFSACSLTKGSLAGWSLLRVAVSGVRGFDAEGCAALVIAIAAVRSLVQTWSRLS